MILEVKPRMDKTALEELVARVFFKAIDLLGGLTHLARYRTLTWLPSLARAVYAVVLHDEYLFSEEEIARELGTTKATVRNILRADPQKALERVRQLEDLTEDERREMRVHLAGGMAKLAYRLVKDGQDAQWVLEFCRGMAEQAVQSVCEAPWPYLVLKHIRGVDYPITEAQVLRERLQGIQAKGLDLGDVVGELAYPIRTPAELLHEIKEYLQKRELL